MRPRLDLRQPVLNSLLGLGVMDSHKAVARRSPAGGNQAHWNLRSEAKHMLQDGVQLAIPLDLVDDVECRVLVSTRFCQLQ